MNFINEHWREGHPLAKSRSLMDWQHRAEDGWYNYLLATNGDEILGVLGYIPTRRYDVALAKNNILWLALWKIRDDLKIPGLGIRMLGALEKIEPNVAVAVNGVNPRYLPIYHALGYQTGELSQYYAVSNFHYPLLLTRELVVEWPHLNGGVASCKELFEHNILDVDLKSKAMPLKTSRYFLERFLCHPFYRYRVFYLEVQSFGALIATRTAIYKKNKALRIVDFSGDVEVFAESGSAIKAILDEEGCEFVDFWQHGFPPEALQKVGFKKVIPGAGVTVPNYFEPFIAKNGRIFFAAKGVVGVPFIITRADGDQDRPNIL